MNYKIILSRDKYDGYLKVELFKRKSFLGIPYWSTACVHKGTESSVQRRKSIWITEFKIPVENQFYDYSSLNW